MSRIAYLFFGVDMRNSHDGLRCLLGKKAIEGQDTAIFVNRAWTMAKLLTSTDVILYVKRPKGINPATIRHLPNCIQGADLNYGKALEAAVMDRYSRDRPVRSKQMAKEKI